MGRVSKRKTVAQEIKRIPEGKTYRAGIYARLSSDQDRKKNESIEVQIEIAKKFVEDYNRYNTGEVIEVVQCYTDLGKTGSNFEREGFLRLLQDVRLGDIKLFHLHPPLVPTLCWVLGTQWNEGRVPGLEELLGE